MRPMGEQRTPIAAALAVAIVGAIVAGAADWSAPAFYAVGFTSIVVFFALITWHERTGERSADASRR